MLLCAPAGAADAAKDRARAEVAVLSDQQVRERLIEDIAVREETSRERLREFNPAIIVYRLQLDVGRLSQRLDGIFAALDELPGVLPEAWRRFSPPPGGPAGTARSRRAAA